MSFALISRPLKRIVNFTLSPSGLFDFDFVIMGINHRTELQLFDIDDFLVFPGFVLFLLLFIFVFAVVENFADGGNGLGRYFDQIQPGVRRQSKCFPDCYDSSVFAVFVNQTNFFASYFLINARSVTFPYWRIGVFSRYFSLLK